MKPVYVLNGPNLGRLGKREPEIYGTETYDDLVAACQATAEELGLTADVRQTEDEGQMLRWLHEAADSASAVVLNPGAWTHYSYAVRDAVAAVGAPVIEVHLSNIAAREEFRHVSVVSGVAEGVIAGFGVDSYRLALTYLARRQ